MRTTIKKALSLAVALTMARGFAVTGSASNQAEYFINDGMVKLEGNLLEATKGSLITVTVVDKQLDWLDKEEWALDSVEGVESAEKFVYYDALVAGEDGAYEVTFALDRKGAYNVYFGCDELDAPICFEVIYVSKDENEATTAKLVSADAEEVVELLKTSAEDLGIYDSIYQEAFVSQNGEYNSEMLSAVAKDIVSEIKTLEDRDVKAVVEFIYKIVVMNMMEQKVIDNVFDYKNYLGLDEDEDRLFSEKVGEDVTKILLGEIFADTEAFDEEVADAIILANVNNANSVGIVVDVLDVYGKKLGVKGGNTTKLASEMLKQDEFSSVDELEEFIADYQKQGSSGGGGGRGSSGGVTTAAVPSVGGATAVGGIEPIKAEKISVFDDLDDVEWAEEAITQLYWQGVVNGKSEGIFAPHDYVTREEFAKMITAAFRMNMVDDEFPFTDVTEDDWCYPYVKTAYLAGITNGVSSDIFGKGMNIIRQDVCVMLCNAVKAADYELTGDKKLEFADYADIADYAKEAVDTAASAGVINGSDGYFMPNSFATRAEAAKMIYYTINGMKSL